MEQKKLRELIKVKKFVGAFSLIGSEPYLMRDVFVEIRSFLGIECRVMGKV